MATAPLDRRQFLNRLARLGVVVSGPAALPLLDLGRARAASVSARLGCRRCRGLRRPRLLAGDRPGVWRR